MTEETLNNCGASSLRNHFLISMPSLEGTGFGRSVTYICDHGPSGAMGIVINRPLELTYDEVFEQLEIDPLDVPDKRTVLSGGPVNTQRGFVLHRTGGEWLSSMKISEQISLTASRDIISAMAHREGPENAIFALGYAGWSAGQLESEISENSWLTVPADLDTLFTVSPEERWDVAISKLGFDPNLIPVTPGHA